MTIHSASATAGRVCRAAPPLPHSVEVPEVLEVELTRRGVASIVGRTITAVEQTDDLVVGPGVDAVAPDVR